MLRDTKIAIHNATGGDSPASPATNSPATNSPVTSPGGGGGKLSRLNHANSDNGANLPSRTGEGAKVFTGMHDVAGHVHEKALAAKAERMAQEREEREAKEVELRAKRDEEEVLQLQNTHFMMHVSMQNDTVSLGMFSPKSNIRRMVGKFVLHPKFDLIIMYVIGISLVLLAVDTPVPALSPYEKDVLSTLDIICNLIFIAEMSCKIVAFGFIQHNGAYLRDGWNVLDFMIVVIAVIDMIPQGGEGQDLSGLKAMRGLRAFRALRAIRRFPALQQVVNALFRAVPDSVNLLMVVLLFFLICSILGVSFFGGGLRSCNVDSLNRTCYPGRRNETPRQTALWCKPENQCVGYQLRELEEGETAQVVSNWLTTYNISRNASGFASHNATLFSDHGTHSHFGSTHANHAAAEDAAEGAGSSSNASSITDLELAVMHGLNISLSGAVVYVPRLWVNPSYDMSALSR
jgi:hypothetical protein